MLLRVLYILIFITASQNAFALGSCLTPLEPECASNEESYNNKEAYSLCTTAFLEMSKKTKEYIECMKSELKKIADDAQKDIDSATDKTNAAIKKFNCRADTRAAC